MKNWKDVIGYEHRYKVNDFGGVFSKLKNRFLSGTIDSDGYKKHGTRDLNTQYFERTINSGNGRKHHHPER